MSTLQTVAMATNNRKDNHFFAIFQLFASLSRVSLDKLYKRSFYFAEGNTFKVSTCFLCFHFCDEFRDDHAHAYQRPTGWCVRNWMPCLLTFQCLLSRVTFAQIFLNLSPSCDFETSSRAVKTTGYQLPAKRNLIRHLCYRPFTPSDQCWGLGETMKVMQSHLCFSNTKIILGNHQIKRYLLVPNEHK